MKKLISLTFILLFMLSMALNISSQQIKKMSVEITDGSGGGNKSWYSSCAKGCQWDSALDCDNEGVLYCTTSNGCGNCN